MTKFRLYDVLAINSRGEHPSGDSGADLVGVKSIPNVSAATVQEALNVIAGRAGPGGATDAAPIGSGQMWFGDADPAGEKWMVCDGRAISRTTYSDLFNVMGTAYGTGDGTSTFNIPDLRARTPIGANSDTTLTGRSTRTRGDAPGAETHTLGAEEMPAHAHTTYGFQATNTTATGSSPRLNSLVDAAGSNQSGSSSSTGGGGAHNNMQPSLAVNFILRVAA